VGNRSVIQSDQPAFAVGIMEGARTYARVVDQQAWATDRSFKVISRRSLLGWKTGQVKLIE
jgi:hypothetical protein